MCKLTIFPASVCLWTHQTRAACAPVKQHLPQKQWNWTQTTKVKFFSVRQELGVNVLLQPLTSCVAWGANSTRTRTPRHDWANDSFTQHRRAALHVRVWIESCKYDMSWLQPEICSDFPETSKTVDVHRSAVTWHLQPLMCFCCARWHRNSQLRAVAAPHERAPSVPVGSLSPNCFYC